ncbi:MAG TPA: hypothetical protein VFB70_13395 [Pyrinomonadaceae bacterium]|nr:hypothetical protein [Pyrinomonadaceae bacterium]
MTTLKQDRKGEAGITLIETVMAGCLLLIGSLGMIGLIVGSIATNNRNKLESTQTMLGTSIIEQINSTIIGSGQSSITDCDGATHVIESVSGAGANLSGRSIDFSENIAANSAKDHYHMDYTVRTPCSGTGTLQGVYDVRWSVNVLTDGVTATNTYLITIGSRVKDHGEGNRTFALPVTIRVMSGN